MQTPAFLAHPVVTQVMIVSYETFRIHAERFRSEGTCDLLICDEVRWGLCVSVWGGGGGRQL